MEQLTLGSCIRSLRIQNHLTQSLLAQKLGVTDKAVSKWERDLSLPDITLFPKLSETLGVTVNDLLSGCREECRPSKMMQLFEVSRDIRMPLHVMLGFTEIAKQNHNDPDLLMRYLEIIKVSGEYLMSLLNCVMQEGHCMDPADGREVVPMQQEPLEQYLRDRVLSGLERQEDYDFSGKRILIVDDVAINREIAAEVLKRTGAETETAVDGLTCLQKIGAMAADYYNLILMDIIMPGIDGLEATRKIRSLPDPDKSGIPIIAMTTNVSENERTAALRAGMNAFCEKPIFIDELLATMSRYL